jgi:endonuclease YncB( thermonuclease family)
MSTRARWDGARGGRWACLIVGAALAVPADFAVAENKTAEAPCRAPAFARASAASVIDGRTFVTDDGREIRLDGIDVPLSSGSDVAAAGAASASAAAKRARDHLQSQLAGRTVILAGNADDRDRYGRLRAQVHVFADGSERWVQGDMVAAGHARVAGNGPCTAALLRHERAARATTLGLWSDPYYLVRRADEPAAVAGQQGRFTIVEGNVLSVRESGGTIYVNFGRRWSEDFTVTIAKRNERSFTAAGLEPKRLDGRRVRVRGWVEARGGPLIEAARPEQIELVERR